VDIKPRNRSVPYDHETEIHVAGNIVRDTMFGLVLPAAGM